MRKHESTALGNHRRTAHDCIRHLSILLVVVLLAVPAQPQSCTTSAVTGWTSTSFSSQANPFQVTFSVAPLTVPAPGTGGPVVGISQNQLVGTNLYSQNASLLRQSDNGYWEVYNGATSSYQHTTAVKWVAANPPTATSTASIVWSLDIAKALATVQITQPGSVCATTCTLASQFPFRVNAPATTLGFWNLDDGAPSLSVCGFNLVLPNPAISSLSPTAGPIGTLVNVLGSNFGASQGNSTVSFGGVPASTVSAWSPQSITATVPNTAQTGNVVVTVNNLMSTGGPIVFTVTAGQNPTPPMITSVTQTAQLSLACGPTQPPPVQHTVVLNWTASTSTGVTGYNIYRSMTSGSGYALIGSAGIGLSYTDASIYNGTPSTTYYYVVTALAGTSESTWSNQVSASIP